MRTFLVLVLFLGFSGVFSLPPRQRGGRLIGGEDGDRSQFPYHVGITRSPLVGPNAYIGGSGALVAPDTVLTTANLIYGLETTTLKVIFNGDLSDPVIIVALPESTIIHPEWNPETLENDLSIIKLIGSATLSDFIQPIPLPTSDLPADVQVTLTGWGANEIEDSDTGEIIALIPSSLQKLTLTTISNEECKLTYGDDVIKPNFACAVGETTEGACDGDGGDPVVDPEGNLVALVSFVDSEETCLTIYPTGLVRIFPYVDWINQNI